MVAAVSTLRFVPEHAIAGIPNVVVDGSPNADTVLTLSHWPGSPTPPELRDDLSAQIAFRALSEPERFAGVEAVTNNHFDQDGIVSAFALLWPALALPRRELLIDVARAGDFGTFASREAARIAMILAALDDDVMSPVPAQSLAAPYPQRCGSLYQWALPQFAEIVDRPQEWRHLWGDEDAHLTRSIEAIAGGAVRVTEHRDVDLAVVTVPAEWAPRTTHRFTRVESSTLHPMAINNATDCLRVAVVQGSRYLLELRYESWVMLVSRPVLPRPDLRVLAAELDTLEPGSARWRAGAPGALTPRLELFDGHESGLSPEAFLLHVRRFLEVAPPAWDPFTAT